MTLPQSSASTLPQPVRSRRWITILLVMVIFVAGFVIGVGATLIVLRNRVLLRLNPVAAARLDAARLRSALDLDDAQAAKVEAILQARQTAILVEIRDELDRLEREVGEVLTAEQQVKWQAKLHQLRSHIRPHVLPESPAAAR